MPDPTIPPGCPHCHAILPTQRFGGLCPACLLAQALREEEEPELSSVQYSGHELIELLAQGGMGMVYRARQLQPEREVALKCMPALALGSDHLRECFRIEAKAMASLDHPAILPIYQFGEQDGVPFFTMKLARGGSLAERIPALLGRWKEITRLMLNVARAVHFAHERGILHQDLKPGNILFDEAGRVYVSDFGLAGVFQEAAVSETGLSQGVWLEAITPTRQGGTLAYLAPEVIGGGEYTARADLWALGIILYELLSGRMAFAGTTREALEESILTRQPMALAAEVPIDLKAITERTLQKDPEKRYASVREFADDLERWLGGRPVTARPLSWPQHALLWSRRNPPLAASFGIICALVLAVLALQTWSNRQLRLALGESYLQESRHLRATSQPWAAAQQAEAAAKLLPSHRLAEIRTEVTASLAFPNWSLLKSWPTQSFAVTGFEAFAPDLESWVEAHSKSGYTIYSSRTGELLRQVDTRMEATALRFVMEGTNGRVLSMHEDGSVFLHTASGEWKQRAGSGSIRSEPVLHPDGVHFLYADETGLWLASPAEHRLSLVAPPPLLANPLALDPSGERIVVMAGDRPRPEIWSVSDSVRLASLPEQRAEIARASWSPDGRWLALAMAEAGYSIRVFDTTNGRFAREFFDHRAPVALLAWHPDSTSLASLGSDLTLVWRSLAAGGFHLSRPAGVRALSFGRDGRLLGFSPAGGYLGWLQLQPSALYQSWSIPFAQEANAGYTLTFSPDGSHLAVIGSRHLVVYDAGTMKQTTLLPLERLCDWGVVVFLGRRLYWSGLYLGVWSANLRMDGTLDRPERHGDRQDWMLVEATPDKASLVVAKVRDGEASYWLWPRADPTGARLLANGFPMVGFRMIPGQNLAFSSHWSEPDIYLWDPDSGGRLHSLGLQGPAAGEPSPDGKWLFTGTITENTIWDTSAWEPASSWSAVAGERDAFASAFTPDSRILAKGHPNGAIELRSVPSGDLKLRLLPPSPFRLQAVRFSPEGDRLIALDLHGQVLSWDLDAIRRELAQRSLDW